MSKLRLTVVFGIMAIVLGCDAMISDEIVVRLPPTVDGRTSARNDTIDAIHSVLESCGFGRVDPPGSNETWTWDKRQPGLHVFLTTSSESIRLRLSQNLFGPRPPRGDFDAARAALVGMLRLRLRQEDIEVAGR